jgi:hypothetical protein
MMPGVEDDKQAHDTIEVCAVGMNLDLQLA